MPRPSPLSTMQTPDDRAIATAMWCQPRLGKYGIRQYMPRAQHLRQETGKGLQLSFRHLQSPFL